MSATFSPHQFIETGAFRTSPKAARAKRLPCIHGNREWTVSLRIRTWTNDRDLCHRHLGLETEVRLGPHIRLCRKMAEYPQRQHKAGLER